MKAKMILFLCLSVGLILSGCSVPTNLPDSPSLSESMEETEREPDRNQEELPNEAVESENSSLPKAPIPEIELIPDTVSLTSHSDWMFEDKEPVILLKSYEELLSYREQMRKLWDAYMEEYHYLSPELFRSCLLPQLDTYEASYFDTHMLAVLCLQEGSGGNRVTVDGVNFDGAEMTVFVTRDKCGITCDMLYWYLFVELELRPEISTIRMHESIVNTCE